jgi:hypothetical protein
MCDKCVELDQKIARYRQLSVQLPDPIITEEAGKLIEEMQAKKAELHPDQPR